MATATLIRNDQDFRVELTETAQGYQGVRHYLVDTSDEVQVLSATGLPQIGDAWDQNSLPNVIAMERGPIRPYTHNQGAGFSIVSVTYRSLFFYGSYDYVPSPGFKFTKVDFAQESVTELFAKEPQQVTIPGETTPGLDGDPIANGQGAPKLLGRLKVEVHRFYLSSTLNGQINFARLMDLAGEEPKTNAEQITTPPLFQSNLSLTFGPGELLMTGINLTQQGRMTELTYTMNASPNHLYRYRKQKADGSGSPETYVARLYDSASFLGLW